jgi:hypothetical protein
MKRTFKHYGTLLALTFLVISFTACIDAEPIDSLEPDDPEISEHHPFHVGVFDHQPTEEEIQDDLARFLMSTHDKTGPLPQVNPTGWIVPLPGQKLVTITATTQNVSSAGTDDANSVRFNGVWQGANGQAFTQYFVLDNPNYDDLNQNSVNVFHYLLVVGANSPDQFLRGLLTNSSTDGWGCKSIAIKEYRYTLENRYQWLPFNQWVDYPGSTPSSTLNATDSSWFYYY